MYNTITALCDVISCHLAYNFTLNSGIELHVYLRVRVTLRLAVYRQSVRPGVEPLSRPEFFLN
jgi:hypothetical protein